MSEHENAIGYVEELRSDYDKQWFRKICDLALSDITKKNLEDNEIKELERLFWKEEMMKKESPTRDEDIKNSGGYKHVEYEQPSQKKTLNNQTIKIRELSGFQNFKKLGKELKVTFHDRLTLIFGVNGSGKSSVSDAIKALANKQKTKKPLWDIRNKNNKKEKLPVSFNYLLNESERKTWRENEGFGNFASHIKCFDSEVLENMKDDLDLMQTIRFEPFLLTHFKQIGDFVKSLEEHLKSEKEKKKGKLQKTLNEYRGTFETYRECMGPLYEIHLGGENELYKTRNKLNDHIINIPCDSERSDEENQKSRKKSSKEILNEIKVLEERRKHLVTQKKIFDPIMDDIKGLNSERIIQDSSNLSQSEKKLANILRHKDVKMENESIFFNFLIQSQDILKNKRSTKDYCPLCFRELDEESVRLFDQYIEFFEDKTYREKQEHEEYVKKNYKKLKDIHKFKLFDDKDETSPLSKESYALIRKELEGLKNASKSLLNGLKASPFELNESIKSLGSNLDLTISNFKEATKKIDKEIGDVDKEIEELNIAKQIQEKEEKSEEKEKKDKDFQILFCPLKDKLESFSEEVMTFAEKADILSKFDFKSLLQRISKKQTDASKSLATQKIHEVLNIEFLELTGNELQDYLIETKAKTRKQETTVYPRVGVRNDSINYSLSEGELNAYYLALFFAEVSEKEQQIIVFDDPANSLDYHFEERYAKRVVKYIKDNKKSQVVLFTHSISFLTHLMDVLQIEGFTNNKNDQEREPFEVMRLEECVLFTEYIEKYNAVKERLGKLFTRKSTNKKITLEEKMGTIISVRRFVELIIEKRIFNNQRYVNRSREASIGSFDKYTQIRPLEKGHAETMKGYWRKLSKNGVIHRSLFDLESDETSINKAFDNVQRIFIDLCEIDSHY